MVGKRCVYPTRLSILVSIIPALLVLGHYIQPVESAAGTSPAHTKFIRQLHNHKHHKVVHRRNGITWCEGTCTNLLVCSIQGGETVRDTYCKGLFSVCCITKPVQSSQPFPVSEMIRVPRQLVPHPLRLARPGIRQGRHKRPKSLPKPPGPPPSKAVRTFPPNSKQVISVVRGQVVRGNTNPEAIKNEATSSVAVPSFTVTSETQNGNHNSKQPFSSTEDLFQPFHKNLGQRVKFDYQNEIVHSVGANTQGCGLSQNIAEERILGGQDAGHGQFPWTALIQIKGQGLDKMCAGTLVSNRFILTAGHCVRYCREGLLPNCSHPIPFSELTFKVVLGEYDVNSKHKERVIQRYHATKVFIHPDFTNIFRLRENGFLESEPRHDMALLKLDRQIKTSPTISSICLPPSSLYLSPGTLATVTGWGRLGVHEGAPHSSTLQAVTVPVLTREECRDQPGASIPTDDQLCAGLSNSRQSSCPGDSGGGLMIRDEDFRWSIIGLVSTGPAECGLTPVIYHNVISSLGWILRTIQRAGGGKG